MKTGKSRLKSEIELKSRLISKISYTSFVCVGPYPSSACIHELMGVQWVGMQDLQLMYDMHARHF